jgi:phosphoribosyl 1,2-cyclic phosphodiesterase
MACGSQWTADNQRIRTMSMLIRFWGVRGSIASPGPLTAAVGGNTSSVELELGDQRLLLDAGTGLRGLGDSLLRDGVEEATLLLSHLHWDHIQGLPFFAPLYSPRTRLHVLGQRGEQLSLRDVLAQQMSSPVFPVRFADLGQRVETRELQGGERFELGDARITVARLNHPGGVLAYRVEHRGTSVVYATDTEHYACVDPALVELASGADVLIYDSQYTPEEYRGENSPAKLGWGHSTFEDGAKLARAAGVGQYVLFHHDPRRTDDAVFELEERARALFPAALAAREGMTLELEARSRRAA